MYHPIRILYNRYLPINGCIIHNFWTFWKCGLQSTIFIRPPLPWNTFVEKALQRSLGSVFLLLPSPWQDGYDCPSKPNDIHLICLKPDICCGSWRPSRQNFVRFTDTQKQRLNCLFWWSLDEIKSPHWQLKVWPDVILNWLTLTPLPIRNIFLITGSLLCEFLLFSLDRRLLSFYDSFFKYQLNLVHT